MLMLTSSWWLGLLESLLIDTNCRCYAFCFGRILYSILECNILSLYVCVHDKFGIFQLSFTLKFHSWTGHILLLVYPVWFLNFWIVHGKMLYGSWDAKPWQDSSIVRWALNSFSYIHHDKILKCLTKTWILLSVFISLHGIIIFDNYSCVFWHIKFMGLDLRILATSNINPKIFWRCMPHWVQ